MKRKTILQFLLCAVAIAGVCCGCSTHKNAAPSESRTLTRTLPGNTDRSAIIDSERRLDDRIVRESPATGQPENIGL